MFYMYIGLGYQHLNCSLQLSFQYQFDLQQWSGDDSQHGAVVSVYDMYSGDPGSDLQSAMEFEG